MPPTSDRARLGPQPRAVAVRARPQRHVLLDLLARELGVGLAVAALEVGDDPLEAGRVRAAPAEAVAIRHLEAVAAGAVQEEVLRPPPAGPARRCRGRRRSARRSPASAGRSSSRRSPPTARSHPRRSTASDRGPPDRGRSPSEIRAPCTAGRRRAGELNEKIRGSSSTRLGPWTGHAKRSEKVSVRPRLRPARLQPPCCRARVVRLVDVLDLDQTVGERDRRLDRVGQPLAQLVLHHQPVDDDRDVVLVLLVEHDLLVEPAQLAVDLDARRSPRPAAPRTACRTRPCGRGRSAPGP